MAKRRKSQPAPAQRAQKRVPSAINRSTLIGALLIALAASVGYFPSLRGAFVLDDYLLLADNRLIKAADGLYRIWCTSEPVDYWPVANSSFWLEWRLWGMAPTGYHITGLVLHIVTALLIWVLLRRLAIPGAFLAALLFAVHPVNVETVAWIAQRKTLLAMLFFLLSILCYLNAEALPARATQGPWRPDRWYALSLAAFIAAMLSKGSVAMLPAVLLLIVWWLRPLTKQDLIRLVPFCLVAAILVRVNVWFQTHSAERHIRSVGFTERLLGAGSVIWFYLSKALVPINLIFIYPQWHIQADQVRWWLPLAAAVVTTGVLWWFRHTWSRPLFFAWVFFCLSLVPVMGFTDVGFMEHSLVADHYQHVALIGVLALVAAGGDAWRRRTRRMATVTAAAVIVAFVVLTFQQTRLYTDSMTLYQTTLEKNPDSWLAHNNLGTVLIDAGHPQEAIVHYEEALRLNPDYAGAHDNLGNALRKIGRLPEAIAHCEEALRLNPTSAESHNTLGVALADSGRLEEAEEHYREAVRLKPDYSEAHNNLGSVLGRTGRMPEAIEHIQYALWLKPENAEAHNNMGNALARTGHLQEAIKQFEQALQLKPDHREAQSNLRIALAKARAAATDDGSLRPQ